MGKSTPILLLGVAGLGLSLAMFFDTKTAEIPKAPVVENEDAGVIDVMEMTDEETEEMKQEIKDEIRDEIRDEMRKDYKEIYRMKKREEERPRIIADHRYKGNGSRFDKKLYFAQQAYRRSREVVPVDTNIALAVKLSRELEELEKNENFEDVLSDSDVEETLGTLE